MGAEVILVGNALPAINDITAMELQQIITQLSELCPVIKVSCQSCLCGSRPCLLGRPMQQHCATGHKMLKLSKPAWLAASLVCLSNAAGKQSCKVLC